MRVNLKWRSDSQARDEIQGRTAANERALGVDELFESHNRSLMRFLTCRLRSVQEAKEVAREAYVRIRQLDTLSGVGYLRAFLFKTAAHLATKRLNSGFRRSQDARLDFFYIDQAKVSTQSTAYSGRRLKELMQVLEELPPKCRYVFIMNRCYGLELSEIAQLMNLPERTVQAFVRRALAFCGERLNSGGERK